MITYDYYRIFYFVATCKSFTKAAEVLHNSQPNITRYMNNLESELNCRLFIRGNHGVTLTQTGEHLLKHVRLAYDQISLAEKEIMREQELESGLLNIGATETALRLMVLPALGEFKERYPNIRTHILSESTPKVLRQLSEHYIDFAVVTSPAHISKPFQSTELGTVQSILLCGPHYRELAKERHHMADLMDYPFISLGTGTGTYENYAHFIMDLGFPFTPAVEASTTEQIIPMLENNLGIGFMPEKLVHNILADGRLFQIELYEEIPKRKILLVQDSSTEPSIASQKMIESLKNYLNIDL